MNCIFIFHCSVLVGIISKFFTGLYIMSIDDLFVFHWPISFFHWPILIRPICLFAFCSEPVWPNGKALGW